MSAPAPEVFLFWMNSALEPLACGTTIENVDAPSVSCTGIPHAVGKQNCAHMPKSKSCTSASFIKHTSMATRSRASTKKKAVCVSALSR